MLAATAKITCLGGSQQSLGIRQMGESREPGLGAKEEDYMSRKNKKAVVNMIAIAGDVAVNSLSSFTSTKWMGSTGGFARWTFTTTPEQRA
jgi:hypothetical protein